MKRASAPLAAVAALLALATPSGARAAGPPCSSYPRPGNTVKARTPADLGAEYGVLRRPRRRVDRLGVSQLGSLSASGIILSGIRFLARVPYGGRAYIVPAEHLLSFPLEPPSCLPRAERPLLRTLLPGLRREYAHEALCLVIVYRTHDSPTCERTPGTFDPLLYAPGAPGFGFAPNGVHAVVVNYFGAPTRRVAVHDNFWIVNDRKEEAAPCGVNWIAATGIVLRIVVSCTPDTD